MGKGRSKVKMLFGKTPFDRIYHRSILCSSNSQTKRYKASCTFLSTKTENIRENFHAYGKADSALNDLVANRVSDELCDGMKIQLEHDVWRDGFSAVFTLIPR